MSDIKVVIGAGYGDEGKGLMTDYYCRQNPDAVVVRFNGGAQAGHTVLHDEHRHVFSHLGSGSLNGNQTYLSEFFVVNPTLFAKEYSELYAKTGTDIPKVQIHPTAKISTPYDMIINQMHEDMRGHLKHGSVGVGFGQTIERFTREDLNYYNFKYNDIPRNKVQFFSEMFQRMKVIRDRYFIPFAEAAQSILSPGVFDEHMLSETFIERYIQDLNYLIKYSEASYYSNLRGDDIIFEGAQGLLLDQDYGHFPHVTRSNTGMRNVNYLLEEIDDDYDSIEVNYVTRAYQTRHGAGPFEEYPHIDEYFKIVDDTNVHNKYQGSQRYGMLDYDAFRSITLKDFTLYAPKDAQMVDTITCLDQIIDEIPVRKDGDDLMMEKYHFIDTIAKGFSFQSYGPGAEHVETGGDPLNFASDRKLANTIRGLEGG